MVRTVVLLLLFVRITSATTVDGEWALTNPISAGQENGEPLQIVVRDAEADVDRLVGIPDGLHIVFDPRFRFERNINGVTARIHQFGVTAERPGTYRLTDVVLLLTDGTRVTLPPARLEVLAPIDIGAVSHQVTAWFEPTRLVMGQVGRLYLRSYSRRDLREPPEWRPPLPQGLELRGGIEAEVGFIVDRSDLRWQVRTLSIPVLATATGNLTVAGQLPRVRTVRDFFNDHYENHDQLPIPPVVCTVIEPPVEGRPADFIGLIDRIDITATLDRERIVQGEGTTLFITMTGDQVDLLPVPTLPTISGVTVYPNAAQHRDLDRRTRRFAYDLVPTTIGRYVIPGISLSWYDPASQRFVRSQGNDCTLEVLPGRRREATVVGGLGLPPVAGAVTGSRLPAPIARRHGGGPGLNWHLFLLLIGLALGLALTRTPRRAGMHRGRQIAAAVRDGDLGMTYPLLDQLERAHPAAATAIDALRRELVHRQFGGNATGTVPRDLLRPVERLR